ncbi:MAG TPA: amino acid adenylation domain-containing protein [Pyrinomonadaceae bacterium]
MTELFVFDKNLKEERDYWVAKLSRLIELPHLKPDARQGASDAGARTVLKIEIAGDVSRQLSRITGGSPFLIYAFLLAALKICLQRHSGSETISVGSPALKESAASNAVALVDTLDEGSSFRQLVLKVRENLLEAYARQRYPFERVLADLNLASAERCPLFDIALVFRGLHGALPEVNNNLTFTFTQEAEGLLAGQVEFQTGLFHPATVETFNNHLTIVLRAAVEQPNTLLRNFPLLSDIELRQQLVDWNATRAEYPQDTYAHDLFARQTDAAPDNVAIEFEDERMSYAEVNARANRLAHYLAKRGVGADVPVGLCMECRPEMVIGILGVLKAGGAYLPIDPSYPRERIAFMLRDAGVSLLLTQEKLLTGLPEHDGASLLLDTQWNEIEEESAANPHVELSAENLAYVIYTSGSTGRPKGAMISHRGLSNYLAWAAAAYDIESGTGAPLHSSIAFDLSVTSLFGPLVAGGRVLLLPAGAAGVESLGEALRRHENFSLVKATPAHARLLGQQLRPEEAAGKTGVLILGGEALTPGDVRFWQESAPQTRIVNEYGPTETVVGCCVYDVRPGEPTEQINSILIGRPIANTQLYILDRQLRPQPVGVQGELYIGGNGLARGYLNRPELTAAKFIPHPFGDEPGARLYKTGDLARYLPDGNIDFLGRMDDQVKVRGYRVELGEVEAALDAHPSVGRCVVVSSKDSGGENRLIAYLVAEDAPTTESLRSFLGERLPQHMIPSLFVVMDELPLTHNGKVDRRQLPAPDERRCISEKILEAPRTPAEEVIAGIWSQVLGLPPVAIRDNFFELGGHSLLVTQVVSRVRSAFGVEMPLRTLFAAPTVAEFTASVEAAVRSRRGLQSPPITRVPRDGHIPLSFAQERLWFLEQWQPQSSAIYISEAARLNGALDITALERTLNEIVRRHEALRTTFQTIEGEARQVIAPSLKIELPVVDLESLPEAEREAQARLLAKQEAQRPFDLAQGPLLRASLLRLGAEEHILLFNIHHIIGDGWSLGVLVREVASIYEAFSHGRPSTLPELPVQYADFAHWQRAWLQGEVLDEQLAYWVKQLGGAPALSLLPSDRPRPQTQQPMQRGARQDLAFSKTLSYDLKALSRREGVTLFMTLAASFQLLLRYRSGQEDLLIGTDVANRTRFETENLIGFFLNQLVLRTDLSGNPSFEQLLGRVRDVTLEAYAYQDLPFGRLVDALKVERSLQHTPLFQIKFVFQNALAQPFQLPNLTVSMLDINGGTSKFDLTLTLWEEDETIKGWFEYNADLYEATTIARLGVEFETILREVADRPGLTLKALDEILDAAKRERHAAEESARAEALAQRFKTVRRRAISVAR